MDDPFFSPESLLSPESLFGAVVEWRNSLVERSSSEAFQALDAMREVHPERERQNRRLFMSSVAEDMNVLAAGAVEYDSNPDLASVTPIRNISPEAVATEQAHIAYINDMASGLQQVQEAEIPEDARRLSQARQNLDALYGREAA